MKKKWKLTALTAIAALGLWHSQPAQAALTTSANLDLTVTFSGQLSVKVDDLEFSTRALSNQSAGVTVVPASSATVTNDSTGITERWQLKVANVTEGGGWSVVDTTGSQGGGDYCLSNPGGAGCPQANEFALQALFISSAAAATCPNHNDLAWDTYVSTVGASDLLYRTARYAKTSTDFGIDGAPDQTTGTADGNMHAVNTGLGRGRRGLCVRLTMPAGSTYMNEQILRLTITALNGG